MTDGQTDGQNYDSQDRASIAASRGKKWGGQWAESSGRMGVGRAVSPVEVRYWGGKFEGNSSKLTDGQFGVSLGKQRNMADRPHCQKLARICVSPRNADHGRTGVDGSVAIHPPMAT